MFELNWGLKLYVTQIQWQMSQNYMFELYQNYILKNHYSVTRVNIFMNKESSQNTKLVTKTWAAGKVYSSLSWIHKSYFSFVLYNLNLLLTSSCYFQATHFFLFYFTLNYSKSFPFPFFVRILFCYLKCFFFLYFCHESDSSF